VVFFSLVKFPNFFLHSSKFFKNLNYFPFYGFKSLAKFPNILSVCFSKIVVTPIFFNFFGFKSVVKIFKFFFIF